MNNASDYNIQEEEKQRALLLKNMRYIVKHVSSTDESNSNLSWFLAYLENKEKERARRMTPNFKPSFRYGKATRSVKAIIRYNSYDGKQVVYYRQGGRFFKLLDNKTIRPMAKTMKRIHNLAKTWSIKAKIDVVENDEQVLFNGVALTLEMDPFDIDTRLG